MVLIVQRKSNNTLSQGGDGQFLKDQILGQQEPKIHIAKAVLFRFGIPRQEPKERHGEGTYIDNFSFNGKPIFVHLNGQH